MNFNILFINHTTLFALPINIKQINYIYAIIFYLTKKSLKNGKDYSSALCNLKLRFNVYVSLLTF
jgi:hypothetical protein